MNLIKAINSKVPKKGKCQLIPARKTLLNSCFQGRRFNENHDPIGVQKMRTSISRFLISLSCAVFFYSNNLLANSGGESMPWESRLQALSNSLTGPVAKVAGVMAIAGAGLMLAMNQSEGFSKTAIRIIFGLTIAFSAGTWGLSFFGFGSGFLIP